ncbi:MAG: rhodanese-like domain-containing protein [Parachlamydiaceae bacterium]|nr:MAG: rhodanese-like domain-containing protein [Parachlamydiaceae bacterium]
MNAWILTGVLILGAFSFMLEAKQTQNQTESHGYTVIHADELKSWYDQSKNMIVVDARSKQYFDGTLLPNAIWLPPDAPAEEIEKVIPSKNALVVVYCWSLACPASKWLADRLVAEGYTHIYKYPEGLQDWMQKGYPTTKK